MTHEWIRKDVHVAFCAKCGVGRFQCKRSNTEEAEEFYLYALKHIISPTEREPTCSEIQMLRALK
jgi:hypothetical protein